MESRLLANVINAVQQGKKTFFRFITANDIGTTGGHQAGFYVPKEAATVLFDTLGTRGENKERNVKIIWQADFETISRFVFYGVKTRNEYRITRFGRNFPFLRDEYMGSLLVFIQNDTTNYAAFVLSTDEDIENFFSFFNVSPTSSSLISTNTNNIISIQQSINEFIKNYNHFPDSKTLAYIAEKIELKCNYINRQYIQKHPDEVILTWVNTEFELFRSLEEKNLLSNFFYTISYL